MARPVALSVFWLALVSVVVPASTVSWVKAVEDAVRLSKEKYCSVSAMLEKTAKITTQIEFLNAEQP